jgi:predicted lipoprotein with Yx(FWY)xxD motif
MTRLRWLITITSIFTVVLAGVGAFTAAATARRAGAASAGPAKITLEKFKSGKILANAKGFTIYAFTRDTKNKDKCVGIKFCKQSWPPVTTVGKPIAGTGVKQSLLGTISVPGVGKQVTYNGHPLYTYAGDGGPHQTYYVNFSMFGGRWPALNAQGQEVK